MNKPLGFNEGQQDVPPLKPEDRNFDEWRILYVKEYPHHSSKMLSRPNSLNKEVEIYRNRKIREATEGK